MATAQAALQELATLLERLRAGDLGELEAQLLRDRLADIVRIRTRAVWEPYPWQVPPGDPVTHGAWLLLGGRGTGKTEGAARYMDDHANGPPCDLRVKGGHRMSIVAPTLGDAVEACVTGPSGLKTLNPAVNMKGGLGGTHVTWPNGSVARLFGCYTPEDVERLRAGGNRCLIWLEEAAAQRRLADAKEHTDLGLRIGPRPHYVISTTPKPKPIIRDLVADPRVMVTKGSTRDAVRLDATVRQELLAKYEGTRTGRQELDAEILDDVEGALWKMSTLDRNRLPAVDPAHLDRDLAVLWAHLQEWGHTTPVPDDMPIAAAWKALERRLPKWRPWIIHVAVDPPGETAECGIVVGCAPKNAVQAEDHCVILDDLTIAGTPEEWGPAVIGAWKKWGATKVYVEKNQGGDMVRSTIHAVDATCPVDTFSASESKGDRAEPVSMLDALGWIHHAGQFVKLEDQLTTWVEDISPSPDRLDARVHLVRSLLSGLVRKRSKVGTSTDQRIPTRGTGVNGARQMPRAS